MLFHVNLHHEKGLRCNSEANVLGAFLKRLRDFEFLGSIDRTFTCTQ